MRGAGSWGRLLAGYAVLGSIVALTFFAVRVNLQGGIFLRDPQGLLNGAAVDYGDRIVPMWRAPGGLYFAWPEGGGELVLRCANGERVERMIIVPRIAARITLTPGDCGHS
jgi:hypothetical protein